MHSLLTILLTLAAAFHAVTGLSSGGRVLCIGADQHMAVEARHDGSCGASAPTARVSSDCCDADQPVDVPSKKDCIDLEAAVETDGRQVRILAPAHDALDPFLHIAISADHLAAFDFLAMHPSWAGPPDDHSAGSPLDRLATIILIL